MSTRRLIVSVAAVLASTAAAGQAAAQSQVSYIDIARDPASGLDYQRAPSAIESLIQDLREQSLVEPIEAGDEFFMTDLPFKANGQPGVAILDYDNDGDLDIYASNGPGAANSLYASQLVETGEARYVDVAVAAGVDATDQDGMGVCYGDIDNDGDHDLFVLGRNEPNRLYVNQGNGTFVESHDSGLGGGDLGSSACSMGDVNGDGLVDVFVANTWNLDNFVACFVEPFAETQHNQLYINNGDGTFADVSATSGIQDLGGLPPWAAGGATITWAVGMVDIDLDGDTDIVIGDDQCALAEERFGGVDRGFIHVMLNDGSARFTDHPIILHDQASSSWMGLAFGDLNCDGHLDMFGSNFGDYDDTVAAPFPYELGDQTTRWLLGNGDGTFTDPAIGDIASVFGWGTGIYDHDNDGDPDIVYHGGIDLNFFHVMDNPGVLLENRGCAADFDTVVDAYPTDHQRRNVQGVALGDLDGNGFVDVVSVSSMDLPESIPLLQIPRIWDPDVVRYAEVLNPVAKLARTFIQTAEGLQWIGIDLLRGSLSVELNQGNDNHWVQVKALGTAGLTTGGRVNRDALGAVITFTPHRVVPGQGLGDGDTVMVPVMGGSSLGSQHSLEAEFGLGSARRGRVEVMWPGGVRNRLYDVRSYERVVVPEIPCSYDADWPSKRAYDTCVSTALDELVSRGTISQPERARLHSSALRAYQDSMAGRVK